MPRRRSPVGRMRARRRARGRVAGLRFCLWCGGAERPSMHARRCCAACQRRSSHCIRRRAATGMCAGLQGLGEHAGSPASNLSRNQQTCEQRLQTMLAPCLRRRGGKNGPVTARRAEQKQNLGTAAKNRPLRLTGDGAHGQHARPRHVRRGGAAFFARACSFSAQTKLQRSR